MRTVTVYGRPGCHLCAEAVALLEALRERGGRFDIRQINIESDPDLHRRFLERIPVLELDGQVISELVPNPDTISRSLDTLGT